MTVRRVALIIFYDNSKILLQDRTGISKAGEEWGFFGGEIEKDETPEQAVVRETKEELNYELRNYEFLGHYRFDMTEDITVDANIFLAPLPSKEEFEQYEGSRMKLYNIDEARRLNMKVTEKIFEDLEKRLK